MSSSKPIFKSLILSLSLALTLSAGATSVISEKMLIDDENKTDQVITEVLFFEDNGIPEDLDRAFASYEVLANQGVAEAQFQLGSMYYFGNSVEHDNNKAKEWWQKAADQVYDDAQYNLGL